MSFVDTKSEIDGIMKNFALRCYNIGIPLKGRQITPDVTQMTPSRPETVITNNNHQALSIQSPFPEHFNRKKYSEADSITNFNKKKDNGYINRTSLPNNLYFSQTGVSEDYAIPVDINKKKSMDNITLNSANQSNPYKKPNSQRSSHQLTYTKKSSLGGRTSLSGYGRDFNVRDIDNIEDLRNYYKFSVKTGNNSPYVRGSYKKITEIIQDDSDNEEKTVNVKKKGSVFCDSEHDVNLKSRQTLNTVLFEEVMMNEHGDR